MTRVHVGIGTGNSIPSRIVPNKDFLENEFYMNYGDPVEAGTNEKVIDKFQQITDIGERRYADDNVLTSDLATEASRRVEELQLELGEE